MEKRWYKVWPMWVPKHFEVEKPASEYIREWATVTPEKIALSFYGRDMTYSELDKMLDRAACGLVDLGVKKGDRVAIHMENCPQFVIAYFGVQRAGGIVVPVNPMFKQAELEYEINDAGAKTLIGLDYLYPELAKVRSHTPLENVILTSLRDYLPEEPVLPLPIETKEEIRLFPDTLAFTDFLKKVPGPSDMSCDRSEEGPCPLPVYGWDNRDSKGSHDLPLHSCLCECRNSLLVSPSGR